MFHSDRFHRNTTEGRGASNDRRYFLDGGALEDLQSYDGLVSSELIAVESARTIDRLRLQGALTLEEAAVLSRAVAGWLEAFDLVLLRPPVLSRASEPLPPTEPLTDDEWPETVR